MLDAENQTEGTRGRISVKYDRGQNLSGKWF